MYIYQWRAVTFQPGDAVLKKHPSFYKIVFYSSLFFPNFIEWLLKIFRYFSKLILDFL